MQSEETLVWENCKVCPFFTFDFHSIPESYFIWQIFSRVGNILCNSWLALFSQCYLAILLDLVLQTFQNSGGCKTILLFRHSLTFMNSSHSHFVYTSIWTRYALNIWYVLQSSCAYSSKFQNFKRFEHKHFPKRHENICKLCCSIFDGSVLLKVTQFVDSSGELTIGTMQCRKPHLLFWKRDKIYEMSFVYVFSWILVLEHILCKWYLDVTFDFNRQVSA